MAGRVPRRSGTRRRWNRVAALAFLAVCSLLGRSARAEPLASERPRIPEPMVFDLVRPLGAQAGEREINVLTVRPLGQGRTDWAPEIEYAYAPGQSIELEFPFTDSRLTHYKIALQGTLESGLDARHIHGWQYIGVYDRDRARAVNALLYLTGYRFDARWSALGMVGVRQAGLSRLGATFLLVNPSVFYDLDAATVVGLELNVEQRVGRRGATRCLIVPQLHRRIADRTSLQAGVGAQFDSGVKPGLVAALRIIQEF